MQSYLNSKEGKEKRDEEGNPVRIFTLRPASGHQEFFDLMRKLAREAKVKKDFFHEMPEVCLIFVLISFTYIYIYI